MADDALFEFLHMEIVSHVYKEHATREDIDRVPSYIAHIIYFYDLLYHFVFCICIMLWFALLRREWRVYLH